MDQKVKYENLSVVRNSLTNSASEHNLNQDNLLSLRVGESLPVMNIDHQQPKNPVTSNLSRFPDDLTDLTDKNLNQNSSATVETKSNEIEKSEEKNKLGRWDAAWDEYEKAQQQEEKEVINESPSKDEKITEITEVPSFHPVNPPSTGITRVYVREFLPKSDRDPIFTNLRDLFVRSFDQFYKQVETQLNLKPDRNLVQWLEDTFDDEQKSIVSKEYRCFLLCGNEDQDANEIILGFLTLKEEEEGSVYIAQVAVHPDNKRRGFGAQLLQHLRNLYPANTQYWGLCRRANRPALQFYLKQGAKFMKNDEVASKYGYDPTLYAGFEFVDTIPVIASSGAALGRLKPNNNDSDQPTKITDAALQNPNTLLADDDRQVPKPVKSTKKRLVGCCTS